ncbi:MAG: thioredoxin domain-containing protein [Thermoanaerobaculum sp.]
MSDDRGEKPRFNRLLRSHSTYLLQHVKNPVDWYPWCPEAFDRARAEDKPIFVSVGYATCHWCHVMNRESFENPEIAEILNRHFIAIKVDRQEHPQVDEVYMRAAIALTGHGGWPLSVFLTPSGKPFFAGTYFPPEPRGGLPGFRELLLRLVEAFRERRTEVEQGAEALFAAIVARSSLPRAHKTLAELEREAVEALWSEFDEKGGGFGTAPKFPMPSRLLFLLDRAAGGDPKARTMLQRTLDRMASGGIRDVLFGGFHRYATDRFWLVPHYEKMLPDNALLLEVYQQAGYRLGRSPWRFVARECLRFLAQLFYHRDTGRAWAPVDFAVFYQDYFLAGWDADTNGEEGKTYTFTASDVAQQLSPQELELFRALSAYPWDLSPEAKPRPLALKPLEPGLARALGLRPHELKTLFKRMRVKLAQYAERRGLPEEADWLAVAAGGLPEADELAVTAWNAMAVWAWMRLAQLARPAVWSRWREHHPRFSERRFYHVQQVLKSWAASPFPPPPGFLTLPLAALKSILDYGSGSVNHPIETLFAAILNPQLPRPQVKMYFPRTIARGYPNSPETLEDLAWSALALIETFLTFGDSWFLHKAAKALDERVPSYLDEDGGFCLTSREAPFTEPRPRTVYDGAHPNPGAVLCEALFKAWLLTGRDTYRDWAEKALAAAMPEIAARPQDACSWLRAARLAEAGRVLVVAGSPQWPSTRELLKTASRSPFQPDLAVFLANWPPEDEDMALLPVFRERPPSGPEAAAAYLCVGPCCQAPVTTPRELVALLARTAETGGT